MIGGAVLGGRGAELRCRGAQRAMLLVTRLGEGAYCAAVAIIASAVSDGVLELAVRGAVLLNWLNSAVIFKQLIKACRALLGATVALRNLKRLGIGDTVGRTSNVTILVVCCMLSRADRMLARHLQLVAERSTLALPLGLPGTVRVSFRRCMLALSAELGAISD